MLEISSTLESLAANAPGPPHSVAARQSRFNRSTRDHWAHFAPHRARVRELILAGREPANNGDRDGGDRLAISAQTGLDTPGRAGRARLCSLGSGNCNDLDLPALLDAFDEVHLVDIDPDALHAAVSRQQVGDARGIKLHAPVDLTAIADVISTWTQNPPPSASDVAAAARRSDLALAPSSLIGTGGPFDVVVSCCVLSQLVGYASDAIGGRHPAYRTLVEAIRRRHLRVMLDLLAPGGAGLLVCDLVSSDSAADDLSRVPEHAFPSLIRKLSLDGNFFTGLHPEILQTLLASDAALAPRVRDVKLLRPWLWRLGPSRTFLVYALRFQRAPAGLLLL